MNWTCTQTEERLSDYLDGLMTPEESAAFSSHAARCTECARLLRQVGGLVKQMKAVELLPAPELLNKKILDATLGSRAPREGWKRFFAWMPVLWSPRFAIGAATVAAVLAIVLHTAGVTPGKLKRADLSPVSMARTANRQVHLVYARGAKFVNDLRVVYEIQSALQRTPEPQPSTEPESQPKSESPSDSPDQKSQTAPKPRSQLRSEPMLALLLTECTRSYR
jgi:anti-sigma factor RsiW